MKCSRPNCKQTDLSIFSGAAECCSLFRSAWPWVLSVSAGQQRPQLGRRGVGPHLDRLWAPAVYFGGPASSIRCGNMSPRVSWA